MIPACKEVSELLSQGQDRPLAPMEKIRLQLHLLLCRGCRAFHRQLGFLRTAVRRYREEG